MMDLNWKSLITAGVAALLIFLFWSVSARIQMEERQMSYSEFLREAYAGGVSEVTIAGNDTGSNLVGRLSNGQRFRTFAPPQAYGLLDTLLDLDVEVSARAEHTTTWSQRLADWMPILLVGGLVVFFVKSGNQTRVVEAYQWRLGAKARALQRLASTGDALTDEEIIACLLEGSRPKKWETEARKALYEMLAERTVEATDQKTYRLRTAD